MAHGIRHVRTQAGVEFFGLPIGTPITEHLYQLKKAEHGGHVPKGLATTNSAHVETAHSGTPKAAHPSLKGTGSFKVNAGEFHAPSGSKVIKVKNQPGMKFVRTPDGTIHAFNDKGEVDLPDNIQSALQKKFTPDFTGDAKYETEDLAESATPKGKTSKPELKDLKSGTVLNDADGNPAFTKQDDGDWKHEALGIDVSDEDIQEDYDSGDLSVATKEENTKAAKKVNNHDFKNMTAAETADILDSDPAGTEYDVVSSNGKTVTVSKNKDGSWSVGEEDKDNGGITSATLSYLHDNISEHKSTPSENESNAPEEKSNVVPNPSSPNTPSVPKEEESPGDGVSDNKAKEPKTPKPEEKKESSEPKDILSGLNPGEKAFVHHTDGTTDTYTKQNDGTLQGTKGIVPPKLTPNALLVKTESLEKKKQSEVEKNKVPLNSPSVHHEPSKPEESEIPIALKDKVSGPASKEDIEALKPGESVYTSQGNKYTIGENGKVFFTPAGFDEPSLSSFKHANLIAGYTPGAKANSQNLWIPKKQEKELPKVEEPEPNIKGFKVGDEIPLNHSDWYDQAPVGTEISFGLSSNTLTKHANGAWVYYNGTTFTSNDLGGVTGVLHKIPEPEEKTPENLDLGSEDNPSLPKVGEHVLDVESAEKLPTGTVLTYTKKDGTTSEYAKLENGNFLTPGGGQIAPDAMSYNFKSKKLAVKSYPNVGTPVEDLDPGHTNFVSGGQVYSDKDMQEALDALQSHTGFQINYGLKSVPENPIAKNQAELKQAAVSAHPELKPKAAAVAFLKDKLGVPQGTSIENDNSPKVSVTAGDQKHEFTASEIQKAVDILEGYDGKLFKNELNKQGSPLGGVDWNQAVGFHKDKIEGKKAVIDLLKKKIEVANQISEAPPESGGPTGHPGVGDIVHDWKDLDFYPSGAEIQNVENKGIWQKKSDGSWFQEDAPTNAINSGEWWPNLNNGNYELISSNGKPDVPDWASDLHPDEDFSEMEPNEDGLDLDTPLSKEDFNSLPIGSIVSWHSPSGSESTFTKVDDDTWDNEEGDSLQNHIFNAALGHGYIFPISKGDGLPKTNESEEKLASALSTNNDLAVEPDKPLTHEEFSALPVGSVVHWHGLMGNGNERTYTKVDDSTWSADDSNISVGQDNFKAAAESKLLKLVSKPNDLPDYAQTPVAVLNKEPDPDSPDADMPAYNQSGLLPGKYSTKNGKAYMIVKSDGSGIYVNGNGEVQKLLPGKVKANHKAGMNNYLGVVPEDEIPNVPDGPTVISVKMSKKSPDVPINLPDGTYFSGTAKDPIANTYEVHGDKVIIKKADGTVVETTKNKLKTIFANGKILDENGNSVLGDNHTGSMYMWNTATTGQSIVDAKEWLDAEAAKDTFAGIFSNPFKEKLAEHGLPIDNSHIQEQILKKYGSFENAIEALGPKAPYSATYNYVSDYNGVDKESENYKMAHHPWNEEALKMVQDQLDEFAKHIDTSLPEGGATDQFDWTTDGNAKMPLASVNAINSYSYWDNASLTSTYNTVKKDFGDGKTIGQVTLTKDGKKQWLKAFKDGNFEKMYDIEVQHAAAKSKVLPNGWNHPGYTANTETHKVSWSSAIDGETAAGTDLGHEWSQTPPNTWDPDEIDNYLVKAQMQNPTYLNATEKTAWVSNHMNGNKGSTDSLSAKAALAHQQGAGELSAAPVWSDSVKPAKMYNPVFTQGATPGHPTSADWNTYGGGPTALSWIKDNPNDPELKAWAASDDGEAWIKGNTADYYWGDADKTDPDTWEKSHYNSVVNQALGQFFQTKWDAWHAEAVKPEITHSKSIDSGEHQVYLDMDINPQSATFGKKYIFKPASEKFIVEQDVAANKLAQTWGFKAPIASVTEAHPQTGEFGFTQEYAPSVGSMKNADIHSLNQDQWNDLAQEHVLDWMLDNDDSHGENVLIGENGHLIGIDKTRSFRDYGHWDGLNPDNMNSWSHTAYSDLLKGVQNGDFTKEQADAMYLAAMKTAKRIQKSNDDKVSGIVTEGVKNRDKWSSKVPNSDALVSDVLERKAGLVDDIDGMWKKLYSKNGWETPEIPAKALGEEHISGWDEPDVFEKAAAGKNHGVSAIHSSGDIVDGHSLLWTEKDYDGDVVNVGQFKVGKKTSEDIVSTLSSKSGTGATAKIIENYPDTSDWKTYVYTAAKESNGNVTASDPVWDETIGHNFEGMQGDINKDLGFWKSDLQPEADGFYHFPSGNLVPQEALFQYKGTLDHFNELAGKVEDSKNDLKAIDTYGIHGFKPVTYNEQPITYSKGDSWYKKLSDGNFLYFDGQTVKVVDKYSVPAAAEHEMDGWSKTASPNADPVSYEYGSAKNIGGDIEDGIIHQKEPLYGGSAGSEWTMTLPTGETVKFRDHSHTSTDKSQHGTVNFKLNKELDSASSLNNVQEYLSTLGLNLDGATEDNAETVYWRQMFGKVMGSDGGTAKVNSARAALALKLEEAKQKLGLGQNYSYDWEDQAELIAKSLTPEQELAFYRSLADETWGAEKVSQFIADEKHLPQYHHLDLSNPTLTSGHSWYKRIDVDISDLQKKGVFLGHGFTSGGDSVFPQIMKTGGILSTENRMRTLGKFLEGLSSSKDQETGGATSVFLRVAQGAAHSQGSYVGDHRLYFNPALLEQVGSYGFETDHYGRVSYKVGGHGNSVNPSNILNHTSSQNEVMVPNSIAFLDYLEVMAIDSPTMRNEIIQQFKAAGIISLRGLPIEDRVVLTADAEAAREKAKELWGK